MVPIPSPQDLKNFVEKRKRKINGFLLSGGCLPNGKVPLKKFADVVREIRVNTNLLINVHTGLIDEDDMEYLKKMSPHQISIDIIGSTSTIENVIGLPRKRDDYFHALDLLDASGLNYSPHIIIGLDFGKIKGEKDAIDYISILKNFSNLVLIVLIPTRGTPMENVEVREEVVEEILIYASQRIPPEKLVLGCMRPRKMLEIEKIAVDLGFKGIVNMEMKKEFSSKEGKNYKCAGSCVLGPGRYDYISASGSLMITGDIIAERISVSGALKSEGSVKVKTSLRCAGATKINGDVIAESISAAGVFRAKKVFGETVKLSGAIDVEKIKGESVQIGGYVSADHISGEEIVIKLSKKKSMVEEIHGEEIEVECERGFFRKCSGRLEAKRIEGEEIRLENVVVDVVKGESVIVGDGCVIGRLEAEDMKISKNSKVKEVIRK